MKMKQDDRKIFCFLFRDSRLRICFINLFILCFKITFRAKYGFLNTKYGTLKSKRRN